MAVTGDFGAMRLLIRQLQGVAGPQFREGLARQLAEAARTQVMNEFRSHQDPYGRPWPALKSREGEPLLDTGRLRASFHGHATPNGFSLSTDVEYAAYHQYGTAKIPRRQMVPEMDTGGIGPVWGGAINREANVLMHHWLTVVQ